MSSTEDQATNISNPKSEPNQPDTASQLVPARERPPMLTPNAFFGFLQNLDHAAQINILNIKGDMVPLQQAHESPILRAYKLHHVEAHGNPIHASILKQVQKVVLHHVQQTLQGEVGDNNDTYVQLARDTIVPIKAQDLRTTGYRVNVFQVTASSQYQAGDFYVKLGKAGFMIRAHDDPTYDLAGIQDTSGKSVLAHAEFKPNQACELQVVLWFEEVWQHDLRDKSALSTLSGPLRDNLLVALTGILTKYASEANNCRILRGNKAFLAHAYSLHCGLELRNGLECRLAYDAAGQAVTAYRSCKGHFFPSVLVSDFLLQFCGPTIISGGPGAGRFAQAARSLKGIEIVVATKSKRENRKVRLQGFGRSVRDHPQALHGIVGSPTPDSVQFPDMLCVNVGTLERPFYYPAEFCKIVEDQLFRGLLPPQLEEKPYNIRGPFPKIRPATDLHPRLFAAVDREQFILAFAEIRMVIDGSPVQTVNPTGWTLFKHELGERFDGKLRAAVKQSDSAQIDFNATDPTWMSRLAELVARQSSITTALVIAAPKSLPRDAVDKIRLFCDTTLGVQCHIVSAVEVNKRLRSELAQDMVKYTGAQARKIFARAMLPGAPELASETSVLASGAADATKLLIGIHITSLQGVYGKAYFKQKPLALDDMFLITITSTTNTSAPNDDVNLKPSDQQTQPNSFTTHEVCQILPQVGDQSKHHLLAPKIDAALSSHLSNVKDRLAEQGMHQIGWKSIAIFQSGLGTKSVSTLEDLFELFKATFEQHSTAGSDFRLSLTSMAPEHSIILTGSKDSPASLQIDGIYDDDLIAFDPESFLEPMYSRPKDSKRVPETPWHIYRRSSKPNADDKSSVTIEKSVLPTILYLAQQASKRGRLLLQKKPEADPYVDVDFPFELSKPREELQGTLYFL